MGSGRKRSGLEHTSPRAASPEPSQASLRCCQADPSTAGADGTKPRPGRERGCTSARAGLRRRCRRGASTALGSAAGGARPPPPGLPEPLRPLRARASLSPFHVGPTHSPVRGGEGLAAAVSTWAAPKGAQGTADSVERTPEGQSSDTHTPEPSGHLAVPSQPPESMATHWPHAS